jgi:hypothetical protein
MSQHIKIYDGFLPVDLCDEIIKAFDTDSRVQPDPQPNYSRRTYLHTSLYREWIPLNRKICTMVNQAMTNYFARPSSLAHGTYHEWADDGYVVARYQKGDACIMHIDGQTAEEPHNNLRIATFLAYLNDVDEGGEIFFPLQNITLKPKKGRVVVFPVGYTHPHEVLPTGSDRYILQTWITDPHFLVVRASMND